MANTDVTLDDSAKSVLSNQAARGGFTHKWTIKYTDIDEGTGSSDTVTVVLGNTFADYVITKAMVNVTMAFAGTGALAIEVGVDGDPNGFITTTNLISVGAGPITTQPGAVPAAAPVSAAAAVDVIEALFTNSSSGAPEDLSAGELDIYLGMINANDAG